MAARPQEDDEFSQFPIVAAPNAPATDEDEFARFPKIDPGAVTGPAELPGSRTLATQPQTWGDYLEHKAKLAGHTALTSTPADVPGNLYNTGVYLSNRFLGTNAQPIGTPGQDWSRSLLGPDAEPQTINEHGLVGAGQMALGAIGTGGLGGMARGGVAPGVMSGLRAAPYNAALGYGVGTGSAMGVDPLWLLGGTLLGNAAISRAPGVTTTATADDLGKAALLRREGVPVNPSDLGPNRTARVLAELPGSGAGAAADARTNAWGDSVGSRFGVRTQNGVFTDGVMKQGEARVDSLFNDVRSSGASLAADADSPLAKRLFAISGDVARNDPKHAKAIDNAIEDVLNKARNGTISADDAMDLLKTKGFFAKRAKLENAKAPYYDDIREAVRDEFRNALPSEALAAYDKANQHYRAFKTVQAARDPNTGIVTPDSLGGAADTSNKRYGANDSGLADLAAAGSRFTKDKEVPKSIEAQGGIGWKGPLSFLTTPAAAAAEYYGVPQMLGLPSGAILGGAAAATAAAPVLSRFARIGSRTGPAPTSGQYYAQALLSPANSGYIGPKAPPGAAWVP